MLRGGWVFLATSSAADASATDASGSADSSDDSSDSGLWAPDVREITSGYYVMYYSVKPTSVRAHLMQH